MADIKQTQLFMSLFRGRTDIYARHWEENGKSGYSPAYEFNWGEFMAHKARGGNLSNFSNKKTLLLTLEVIKSHLEGIQAIGIYPLLEDNTSYFIAADFDKENWQTESINLIKICKQLAEDIRKGMEDYKKIRDQVLLHQDIDPDSKPMDLRDYARYALKDGIMEQKRQLIKLFNNQLYIKDKTVISKG